MIGSHSGWGTIAVPGDEPGFVVVPGELDERGTVLVSPEKSHRRANPFMPDMRLSERHPPCSLGYIGPSEPKVKTIVAEISRSWKAGPPGWGAEPTNGLLPH